MNGSPTGTRNTHLAPHEAAGPALYRVLLGILETMEGQMPGIEADEDPERLHDFRVAVRQTRTLLGQFESQFADEARLRYGNDFRWLGTVTGPRRDLDVYLERLKIYEQWLPAVDPRIWQPLRTLLQRSRQNAHRRLLRNLKGTRYKTLAADWRAFLEQPTEAPDDPTIYAAVSIRIRKLYRRLIRQGRASLEQDASPDSRHMVRITCKKLRYVMEIFAGLYRGRDFSRILKTLKGLQAVLGDYNDFAMEREHLLALTRQLLELETAPAETLLVMGRLDVYLDVLQSKAESAFAHRFQALDRKSFRKTVRRLFRTG